MQGISQSATLRALARAQHSQGISQSATLRAFARAQHSQGISQSATLRALVRAQHYQGVSQSATLRVLARAQHSQGISIPECNTQGISESATALRVLAHKPRPLLAPDPQPFRDPGSFWTTLPSVSRRSLTSSNLFQTSSQLARIIPTRSRIEWNRRVHRDGTDIIYHSVVVVICL